MFRAYTSIRSGVLQTKARMCMQVSMRWLGMRLGGQVHSRGLGMIVPEHVGEDTIRESRLLWDLASGS